MSIAYPLADAALAERIESAVVEDLAVFAVSARETGVYPEAVTLRAGGGIALWLSHGNVVNGAFGIGMDGAVDGADVDAIVEFFERRSSPARLDVCPLADESLLPLLAERGFRATGFEMVLHQPLPASGAPLLAEGVTVGRAEDRTALEAWAELEARGFRNEVVSDADRALARSIAMRADGSHFTGYVDGTPAGTGMLVIRDRTALLNGDSTVPALRRRGVQSAILAERLRHAGAAGCDLAIIEAAPGSASMRNQERAGFRVAYNRVTLERPSRRET